MDFIRELVGRLRSGQPAAVIGLDPRLEALPRGVAPDRTAPERIVAFYREALPVIARHAPVVKPNIAFFECFGATGYAAYEQVCADARKHGLLVLADIKRGDIGSTAEAYAEGHYRIADAVTLHPYLGRDSVEPFLAHCRKGKAAFVLVRTSNPGAKDFQDLAVDGEPLCDRVARAVTQWSLDLPMTDGWSPLGAVVGATWPREIERLRALLPHAFLLLPGVGAQGAKVADLAAAFDRRGLGALVNQSRGVMQPFAPHDKDWLERIERAARTFADELRAVAQTRAGA